MSELAQSPAAARMMSPLVVVFALLAVTVLAFRDDAVSLAHLWQTSEANSHGFLIVALIPLLVWSRRHDLDWGRAGAPLAVGGCLAATAAWAAAESASIEIGRSITLPLISWFAVWAACGWITARVVAFPLGFAYFAMPVFDPLIPPLQAVTTRVGAAIVRLAGVPTSIDGIHIRTPNGAFDVISDCAGVHFLVVALAVAAVYAFFGRFDRRRIALALVIAALIALVANWIRVASIMMVGELTAMRSSLMTSHYGFGLAVYAIALIPLGLVLRWLDADHARHDVPSSERHRAPMRSPVRALGIGVCLLATGPVWGMALHLRERAATFTPRLPPVTDWHGPASVLSDWLPTYPGAAISRLLAYTQGETTIEAFIAGYAEQARGRKLIGYDSSIAGAGGWREVSSASGESPVAVRSVELRNVTGERRIVWYWYELRGVVFTSPRDVKSRQAWTAFGADPRSGVVAISEKCSGSCENAQRSLRQFYEAGGRNLSPGTDPR